MALSRLSLRLARSGRPGSCGFHGCSGGLAAASRPAASAGMRAYSYLHRVATQTISMTEDDLRSVQVNKERLMESLHTTCSFGTGERWGSGPHDVGMHRLALSDADWQARDWFVRTTEQLGCTVTVDAMGNIFAVRPGAVDGQAAPATFAGSHLDTQPTGGRYDGILGVQAGIEMLQVLEERGIETAFPVGVVNWTNEEGARFPVSMMASGVCAGAIPAETAYAVQEVGGGGGGGSGTATVQSELERIGYRGATPASYTAVPMAAHFELHIEQGPVLEAAGHKIGVVTGVQSYKWFTIDVRGGDCHTGTTPFAARADAMLRAARMIVHSQQAAAAAGALASTGIVAAHPGSTNTVPGHVRFSLDIRAPRDATVDALEAQLRRDFAVLARGDLIDQTAAAQALPPGKPGTVSWQSDTVSPATLFHPDYIAAVRASAQSVLSGLSDSSGQAPLFQDMTSGAGHDSVYASRRCPTSMIFVPCRDGVSHNPAEFAAPEDCAIGAAVLCQSVLRYDQLRYRRSQEVITGQ